jgi:hypothetical protein
MNVRLALAEIHIPRFIGRKRFRALSALTARAFEEPLPDFEAGSFEQELDSFSRWTQALAEKATQSGPRREAIEERLRAAAFDFGRGIGRELGLRNRNEVMRAARLLYRILGIDFRGTDTGEIVMARCFFSGRYAPATCALIASLDEGVLAGLAGGGTLAFQARITDGAPACRARFVFPETLP